MISATRYNNGDTFYTTHDGRPDYSPYVSYEEKIRIVFSNPAVLKVFRLNCDLFSLGRHAVLNSKGKELLKDPLYLLLKNPNFIQDNHKQFYWDYMFWNMIGTAYLWSTTKGINSNTQLYWLNPAGLDIDRGLEDGLSKIFRSRKNIEDLKKKTIRYTQYDGSILNIPLNEISAFFDLSNGVTNNWFSGLSAIDALYKVVSNIEATLDAKNINTRFTGKFLVSGKQMGNDNIHNPLTEQEKRQIEENIQRPKSVTAVKNMADIKRYVENMKSLKLDESYRNDFLTIGSMYNIPKDILDASFEGSTYENQEKATGRHVEYVFRPKADALVSGIEKRFNYTTSSKKLVYRFDHLSFMKLFKREEEIAKTTALNNLSAAKEQGILSEEEFLERGKKLFGVDE